MHDNAERVHICCHCPPLISLENPRCNVQYGKIYVNLLIRYYSITLYFYICCYHYTILYSKRILKDKNLHELPFVKTEYALYSAELLWVCPVGSPVQHPLVGWKRLEGDLVPPVGRVHLRLTLQNHRPCAGITADTRKIKEEGMRFGFCRCWRCWIVW